MAAIKIFDAWLGFFNGAAQQRAFCSGAKRREKHSQVLQDDIRRSPELDRPRNAAVYPEHVEAEGFSAGDVPVVRRHEADVLLSDRQPVDCMLADPRMAWFDLSGAVGSRITIHAFQS